MKHARLILLVLIVGLLVAMAALSISGHTAAKSAPAYIGNLRSYVFHRPTCSYLPAEKNRTHLSSRTEAIEAGYRPCRKCRP